MKKNIVAIIFIIFVCFRVSSQEGMLLCAENRFLKLYYDPATTEIAVEKDGKVWYSNPADRYNDSDANARNLARLSSQLRVTIFSDNDQMLIFNNYADSIENNSYKIEEVNNGLRVEYTFTNYKRGADDIPKAVKQERFEERFLGRMESGDRELFLERYQLDEEAGLYFAYSIPKFREKDFLLILDKIGYSRQELVRDNEENSYFLSDLESENEVDIPGLHLSSKSDRIISFTLSIIYRIDGDDLCVDLDTSAIDLEEGFLVQKVELLEFFGSAGEEDEGYMFVPDGSGALIFLNNGKQASRAYQKRVYGMQDAENPMELTLSEERISFPVFGIKCRDQALFAVIEEGAETAEINADVSGRLHSYNHISPGFVLLEKGRTAIGSGSRRKTKLIFPESGYNGRISVRYSFLSEDAASYTGMADCYREYLLNNDELIDLEIPEYRLNIEFLGAVYVRRSSGWISHNRPVVMTSLAEAGEIIRSLKESGIRNANIRYDGWLEGGLRHFSPCSAGLDKRLGGADEFRELAGLCESIGYGFYPDISLTRVYHRGRGFSPGKDGVRLINRDLSRFYSYNPSTFQREDEGRPGYYISPVSLERAIDGFISGNRILNLSGITINDFSILNGDYNSRRIVTRGEAIETYVSQLKKLKSVFGETALSDPLVPFLSDIGRIFDFPSKSSGYNILDKDIPFNALVLHGCIPYSQYPLDPAGGMIESVLKSLETGSGLCMLWTHQDSSLLKETEYNYYCSTRYENWLNEFAYWYREIEPFLTEVSDLRITEHRELADGVVLVSYGGTKSVIINYNTHSVEAEGFSLSKQGYVFLEGNLK